MIKTLEQTRISERLREAIEEELSSRGKFTFLGNKSGIPSSNWKNFYYKRQEATGEMINFWIKNYPDWEYYLFTGNSGFMKEERPIFGVSEPDKDQCKTLRDRLNWVIREWASPRGEKLFKYLEEKAGGAISAKEWADVVLDVADPSIPMLQIVLNYRPQFSEWVLLGRRSNEFRQVDPTDKTKVHQWHQMRYVSDETLYKLWIQHNPPKVQNQNEEVENPWPYTELKLDGKQISNLADEAANGLKRLSKRKPKP